MKKLVLGLIALAFLGTDAWSKCDGESNLSVIIPLKIENKESCYQQKSPLAISTGKVREGIQVDFEISPMAVSFENVPGPAMYHYLNIEYSSDQKPSRLQILSYFCSGEIPLGGDALGGGLLKLAEEKEVTSDIRVFIATGQAAENISISQEKKARAKIFDKFLEIYESRSSEAISIDEDISNVFIPNILTGSSLFGLNEVERKLYSIFFARTNSSINGCSLKFRSVMQDHLLENVVKYRPFPGIEVSKKIFSPQYRMRWTL